MAVNRSILNSSPGINLNGVLDTVIIILTKKKKKERKKKKETSSFEVKSRKVVYCLLAY